MGMNSAPKLPDNPNLLKEEILDRFNEGGPSDMVERMLDEWIEKRSKEADALGNMESRIIFELELLELRNDLDQDATQIMEDLELLRQSALMKDLDRLADRIEMLIRLIFETRD